jgi:acyltransferase
MANAPIFPRSSGPRVTAVDIARLYGMVLVYYGHIIEQVMLLKVPVGAMQYKFIYSFHMPFFFLLAGYAANPDKLRLGAGAFFKRLAASRLLPYAVFAFGFVLLHLLFTASYVAPDLSTPTGWAWNLTRTALGFPMFNIPLWFLALLVSVEVLHSIVGRRLTTDTRIVVAAVCFYLFGYYLTLDFQFVRFDKLFQWNYWFVHEAPVVYAFYLVGVLLRRRGVFAGSGRAALGFFSRPRNLIAGALICLLLVWLTYDRNQGPFRFFDAVVIVLSGHGNVFWFPFTALVGSFMLLLLARATGENRFLAWMGQNVLILFILNGVFYHFLNAGFAAWVMDSLPHTAWAITGATALFTALSLLLCLPVMVFLNKYLPQLVGKPQADGPFLRRLL